MSNSFPLYNAPFKAQQKISLPKLIKEPEEHKKQRYKKRFIHKVSCFFGAIVSTFLLFALAFMEKSMNEMPEILSTSGLTQVSAIQEEKTKPEQQELIREIKPELPPIKAMPKISVAEVPPLQIDYAVSAVSTVSVSVPTPPELTQEVSAFNTPFTSDQLDEQPAILYNPRPAYPKNAIRAKLEGEVLARVLVNSEGKVMNVEILPGPFADIFRAESINALKRWRFKPGKVQGKQVATIIEIPLVFSLRQ